MNPVKTFESAFEPYEDGYLYYATRWSGGKFITSDERDQLVRSFSKVANTKAIFLGTSAVVAASVFISLVVPDGIAKGLLIIGTISVFVGRVTWTTIAPARLVRHRPAVFPPRSSKEISRQTARWTSWPRILLMVVVGALLCARFALQAERDAAEWLWLALGVLILLTALWQAISKAKYRDD